MRVDQEIYSDDFWEALKERLAGKVDIQLGKNGVTDSFINEVKVRLRKQGVVKVRVLRSFRRSSGLDVREIAEEVAEKTGAVLYEVRGFTFILLRKG